eukprot:CAMPEP_0171756056 /NCGR_PEP_ID=MMETSP0991-20121206/44833_1 /TAXON_ID=483369 /ORGANISM="non described non described, Strain CCMP2098" /LENGTH=57 /DNA_ID=CAMNT_0012358255 /DNA_START=453 /DNA_END=626 /DNA_ORIENTATION=-
MASRFVVAAAAAAVLGTEVLFAATAAALSWGIAYEIFERSGFGNSCCSSGGGIFLLR